MNELEKVEEFIFNDDVQSVINKINNNFIEFNVFDITGMGSQEIKHSNVLSWLFEANEHGLESQVLECFLKEVIKNNSEIPVIDELRAYVYLSKENKDIKVFREKDNIDLLIVDYANQVVIVIENKIYADERIEGDADDGQLPKYEQIIKTDQELKDYDKYFIYLTKDMSEATKGQECWLRASYQNITDVLDLFLITKNEMSLKTKIIFESYINMLKRMGIVEDAKLKEICKQIWNKKEYREAFEIILNNKPHKYDEIIAYIQNFNGAKVLETKKNGDIRNIFVKFCDNSPLIYRFIYNIRKDELNFVVVSRDNIESNNFNAITINGRELQGTNNHNPQYGYNIVSRFLGEYQNDLLTNDAVSEGNIINILETCLNYDENFITR